MRASAPRHVFFACVIASAGWLAAPAMARTPQAEPRACSSNADCERGEYCEYAPCATPDGQDPSECAPAGYCYGVESGPVEVYGCSSDADCDADQRCELYGEEGGNYGACLPTWMVPCQADADCGAGLRCVETGGWDGPRVDPPTEPMPMPGAEPAGEAPPQPPQRMGVSVAFCLPGWAAPCDTDNDCGAHFTCEEEEICWCSGGGAPGWDGDAPTPEPFFDDPDCGCELAGSFSCVMEEITCAQDSDCPADWTCEEVGGGDGVCWASDDGDFGCTEPDPSATESLCFPPYYNDMARGWGGAGGSPTYGESDTSGPGAPRPGTPDLDGAPPSATPAPGESGKGERSAGGCSSLPASAPSTSWLGLLGLGLVALRRRLR